MQDVNIVATMLVWGAPRLLTNNLRDFARYVHLITVVPLTSQGCCMNLRSARKLEAQQALEHDRVA